jgi:hypothetical protein
MLLVALAKVGVHKLEETFQTRDHRIVRQGLNNKVDFVTAKISTKVEWHPFLTNLGGNTLFRSLKCIEAAPKQTSLEAISSRVSPPSPRKACMITSKASM